MMLASFCVFLTVRRVKDGSQGKCSNLFTLSFNTNLHRQAFYRREMTVGLCSFSEHSRVSLFTFFIIYLYIDSTACVDRVYFCSFDLKRLFYGLCENDFTYLYHTCIIGENDVGVYPCYPPGLSQPWQLSVRRRGKKGLCLRYCDIFECCTLVQD